MVGDAGDLQEEYRRGIGRVQPGHVLEQVILAGVIVVTGGAGGGPGHGTVSEILQTPPIRDSVADTVRAVDPGDLVGGQAAAIDPHIIDDTGEGREHAAGGLVSNGQRVGSDREWTAG